MSVQPNDVHSKQLKHWGDKAPMLKSLRRKEKSINKALDKKKTKDSAWLKSEKERHEFDKGKAWAN